MTNVKVIYHSKSGHTKKIADVIAKVCGVEAIDITEPHTLGEVDLLFIGMGIYAGKPDHAILNYLDNLPANTIKGAALFTTSARAKDCTALAVGVLEHKNILIYNERCNCRGQFLIFSRGRPNHEDTKKARKFARQVLKAFGG